VVLDEKLIPKMMYLSVSKESKQLKQVTDLAVPDPPQNIDGFLILII
jgi:hypothetical protein